MELRILQILHFIANRDILTGNGKFAMHKQVVGTEIYSNIGMSIVRDEGFFMWPCPFGMQMSALNSRRIKRILFL